VNRKLHVVLPSYNEEVALSRLFPQFEVLASQIKEELQLVVVDDGSSDQTAVVATSWMGKVPVQVVRFPENRGYGAALEAGIRTCSMNLGSDDLIATMDADDTHPPSYLVSMIEALDTRNLDVVIASRYAPGSKQEGVPWYRRVLSKEASRLYRWVFHLPEVHDYSCGYRLFRAGLAQRALAQRKTLGLGTGFYATGELLLCLREQTVRFGEVPFELHYERKPTASKMPTVQTIIGTIRFLIRVKRRL
jgi:dolichol-phosphate mannosyltransferase